MGRRSAIIPVALFCALAVAACGSSSSIELAPSAGATQVSTPTTPKPPPDLATKPVVHIPPGSCSTKALIRKDLIVGNGQSALAGQTVTVNYVGVLCKNGKEFDSSWSHGQPASFALSPGSVIQGWVEGIPGMRVGGRRELVIPASLAYGKSGRAPIPPNAPLVFVVDLLSVS